MTHIITSFKFISDSKDQFIEIAQTYMNYFSTSGNNYVILLNNIKNSTLSDDKLNNNIELFLAIEDSGILTQQFYQLISKLQTSGGNNDLQVLQGIVNSGLQGSDLNNQIITQVTLILSNQANSNSGGNSNSGSPGGNSGSPGDNPNSGSPGSNSNSGSSFGINNNQCSTENRSTIDITARARNFTSNADLIQGVGPAATATGCSEYIQQKYRWGCSDSDDGTIQSSRYMTCGQAYGDDPTKGVQWRFDNDNTPKKACSLGYTYNSDNSDQSCSLSTCCKIDTNYLTIKTYPAQSKIMFCYDNPEWKKMLGYIKNKTTQRGGSQFYFTTTHEVKYNTNSEDPESELKLPYDPDDTEKLSGGFQNEIETIYTAIKNDVQLQNDDIKSIFDITQLEDFDITKVNNIKVCLSEPVTDEDNNECSWLQNEVIQFNCP